MLKHAAAYFAACFATKSAVKLALKHAAAYFARRFAIIKQEPEKSEHTLYFYMRGPYFIPPKSGH